MTATNATTTDNSQIEAIEKEYKEIEANEAWNQLYQVCGRLFTKTKVTPDVLNETLGNNMTSGVGWLVGW